MGQGLFIVEVLRSHSRTPHSLGHLWTSDQPVAETSTWQHKHSRIPYPGEIRTCYSSKRVATDSGLRTRGHWHRYNTHVESQYQCYTAKCFVEVVKKLVLYIYIFIYISFWYNRSCIMSNKITITKKYTKYFHTNDVTHILQSFGNALCWITHWQRHLEKCSPWK